MYNVYIHTGVQWEHREYLDTNTMTAYNVIHGREEDTVYVSMMQDCRFELPKGTVFFYTHSNEYEVYGETRRETQYRRSLDRAMEKFYCNPIKDKDLFDHFFYEVGFYPSEENLQEAREWFNTYFKV